MAGDCEHKEKNLKDCNCTYSSCDKTGICCECVRFHRNMGEVPGCFFTKEGEATYDRSFRNLGKHHI